MVYVEHNTPEGDVPRAPGTRSPTGTTSPLVHVTHFNALFWDTGRTPTAVIEHGVADPGHRYTGELPRAAAVINEPVRRSRVAGTDLLPRSPAAPLDVFGMGTAELGRSRRPSRRTATCRSAAHARASSPAAASTCTRTGGPRSGWRCSRRWRLGMPVVALAATEAVEAVPPEAGVVSDPARGARRGGAHATSPTRRSPGRRARPPGRRPWRVTGSHRFLGDWDRLLEEVAR